MKRKRKPYHTCPYCGGHLDYGEKCTCREERGETVKQGGESVRMDYLIRLIEERREIGKRPAECRGGNRKDWLEYERLGNSILEEINRLYAAGVLEAGRKGNGHEEEHGVS